MGWAPDSGAFYITESEGLTTGSHTDLYLIHNWRLKSLNPNRIIAKDFERHHRCGDERFNAGNSPNIGGLTWTDAHHLLLIAEVPNLGICQQMKYFGGYLFSINSRQVTEDYDPEQLKERWGNVVGPRLESNFQYLNEQQRTSLP